MLAVQQPVLSHNMLMPPTAQHNHHHHHHKVVTDTNTLANIKLPSSAVYCAEQGLFLETDKHRLAQRQKQIKFGKVAAGHRSYVGDGRQHPVPVTPRVDQVCSKRSWDQQMGQWRRLLTGTEDTHRTVEPRNHFQFSNEVHKVAGMHGNIHFDIEIGKSNHGPHGCQQTQAHPLAIKCLVVGDAAKHHKLIVSPRNIPFTPFKKLLEDKVNSLISKIYYRDEDGDVIVTDDDMALKVFLEGAGTVHPTKLYLELDTKSSDSFYGSVLTKEMEAAVAVVSSYYDLSESQASELRRSLADGLKPMEMPPLLTPPSSCRQQKSIGKVLLDSPISTPYKNLIACIPAALLSPTSMRNIQVAKTPSPMKDQLSLLVSRLE
eukprot:TRINITY_DN2282_c0_g1_i2.p1 TRINITY_DN2282_c0_g1~~TRINITY_DN2282_c0_g1_i2.p1  ORF type:complete len:375 (+),score=76.99 TRINITY_DN2282_c0_g1_i2:52-1176(+)